MVVTFSSILGQGRIEDALRREVQSGRLHHAHLFVGPDGVGKRRMAQALAAALNCENLPAGELHDACWRCASCSQFAAGQHPDYREIAADGRFIKMEQVREVLNETRFRPYNGRWRIVVFDGAETLKEEAANALLKTLEEPGQGTIFVLLTSQPNGVLETIRSRAIPLRFAPLSRDDVRAVLVARGVSGDALDAAAAMSGGSVSAAIGSLESTFFGTRRERVERLVEAVRGSDLQMVELAELLAKTKEELRPTLSLYFEFFRDVALLGSGGDTGRLLHPDLNDVCADLAAHCDVEYVCRCAARAEEAQRNLLGNVHPVLAVEGFLFDVAMLLRATPRRPRPAARTGAA